MEFKDVEEAKEVSKLFKDIFESALKGNPYLEKGVMTGVLNLLQSGMLSGLNNVSKHNFTSQMYAKHYGINNEEMNHLLRAFSIGEKQKLQIKEWYNGYREYLDEKNFQDKYNIWSVVNYLTKQGHGFKSYWGESGIFEFIDPLFQKQTFKEKIESLIYGESIAFGSLNEEFTVKDLRELQILTRINENSEIDSNGYDLIFSYLYITGYLTIERGNEFRIPNKELRKVFGSRIKKYYIKFFNFHSNKLQILTNILEKILTEKKEEEILNSLEEFRKGLEHILEGINLINKNEVKQNGLMANEDLFHSLINMIAMQIVDSKFGTEINTAIENSQRGRADIYIIKDNSGIIFEIKYNGNSKTALVQAKKYRPLIKNSEKRVFIGCNIANDKKVTLDTEIQFGKSGTSQ